MSSYIYINPMTFLKSFFLFVGFLSLSFCNDIIIRDHWNHGGGRAFLVAALSIWNDLLIIFGRRPPCSASVDS